jgi:hypothetical protein
MRWMPARTDDGSLALLLERRGQALAEAMLIVLHDTGFWLLDSSGEILATASDLPALLDAVDGGVAESQRRWVERPAPFPALRGLVPSAA